MMSTKRTNRAGDEWNELDDLQAMLHDQGYPDDPSLSPGASLVRQIEAFSADAAELRRLRALEAEIPALRELADLGRRYRAEVLDEVVAAGRGAQGAGFPEPMYRELLADQPIDTIKRLRDDWLRSTNGRAFTAGAALAPRTVA